MRRPLTWLVHDIVSEPSVLAGAPRFLIGRAELEHPNTVTVSTRTGRIQGTWAG